MAVPQIEQWAIAPSHEGSLAKEWERRLRPRPRGRRRPHALSHTVLWLGLMWALGLTATFAAVRVMEAGYRLDQLTAQYQAVEQQNQVLRDRLVAATSAPALAAASQRLHMPVTAPAAPAPVTPAPPSPARAPSSLWGRLQWVLLEMRRAWLGQ